MITEFFAHLGGRMEDRVLHMLHATGGSIKEHTDAMLVRASRTVRRGSLVFMLALVGVTLLAVGWVMLNLALHSFLLEHFSVAIAHLMVMGINLLAGAVLLVVAAKLTLTVDGPMPLPRRRPAGINGRCEARRQRHGARHARDGNTPSVAMIRRKPCRSPGSSVE